MARILALALLLLPFAVAAHPGHGPDWHATDTLGFMVLAAIAAGSLRMGRSLEKRGA